MRNAWTNHPHIYAMCVCVCMSVFRGFVDWRNTLDGWQNAWALKRQILLQSSTNPVLVLEHKHKHERTKVTPEKSTSTIIPPCHSSHPSTSACGGEHGIESHHIMASSSSPPHPKTRCTHEKNMYDYAKGVLTLVLVLVFAESSASANWRTIKRARRFRSNYDSNLQIGFQFGFDVEFWQLS